MTQMSLAKQGIFTREMELAIKNEEISKKEFLQKVAEGKIVIPANRNRKREKYFAIGEGTYVKINVNLGVSEACPNFDLERQKLELAKKFDVESVMDLSSGLDASNFRKYILQNYDFIVGTVPVYQVASRHDDITKVDSKEFIEEIERQAEEGVDFFTIHAGITRKALERLEKNERLLKIVSRGGALLYKWMMTNRKENPLYEHFDEILKICKKHDVTISLGDSLRPGAVYDATDALQIEELINLGELTKMAWKEDVQVMIEGPGHMRANEIAANMVIQKRLCHGAPFYVLGPLTTDIAAGYDHISGAMGALIAALNGADFLCYVTPAEHLRLPSLEDVKEGIVAFKIAAHSANIAKGFKKPLEKDIEMSVARRDLDWEKMISISVDPEKAREYRSSFTSETCSMCGRLCAVKNSRDETIL
ncbi:thiamine biosynthesis protein ThiC [Caldicellulosiruptor obsidiansis OB47]|uniref:Phosphomethylpyrimidine synthase n=1 Tax=Caldicellulosiruptor obsidiansis (strain ATCC BAA-2073 / JCM 16842 / OB47) TaxID=608506 RepID=D9TI47_CALOO|nr:phosphomethylpyrimidine synthase ThiC [Caldicellulosiruptor obsidiansis]ADL41679.1 thiamine biosynthesis protein ThiC [Caldicellulosiruptor obsidiansis OB47]